MTTALAVDDATWAEYEDAAWEWARDTAEWFEARLQIMDTDDNIVPLVCNEEQMFVLFWVGMQIAAGVPIRLMILKARRLGISTVITALLTMWAVTRPNYRAFAAAHDADGTNTLWEMAKLFREGLEGTELDRPTDFSNTKAIVYAKPHRSSYRFQTAGGNQGEKKAGIGRSKQITAFHDSERAFIPNWPAVSAGIASCIPDTPQSAQFDETTANGATGEFYDSWNRNVASWRADPRNLYCTIPLFFPWLNRKECSRTVPAGYQWGERDEKEQWLTSLRYGDEQLYWRRMKIADDYSGDPETFAQEYPATPEEAFRASGSPAIPPSIITHHDDLVAKAGEPRLITLHRVCDERTIDANGIVEETDLPNGTVYPRAADGSEAWFWRAWKDPREKHDYTVFGDVAEGKLADPANERSDLDSHAGAVLDRRDNEYVASGDGRKIDADEFGDELRKLAEWYNDAWASPDMTGGYGSAAIKAFTRSDETHRPYNRVFQRVKEADSIQEGVETALWGLKFTTGNRPHIITAWLAACRHDPSKTLLNRWEDAVSVCDPQLVIDERNFVRRKDGKLEHAVNCHDDMLFAHMGAWWLHLQCPRVTYAAEEIPREPNPGLRLGPSEGYAGGKDSYVERHSDDGGYEQTV